MPKADIGVSSVADTKRMRIILTGRVPEARGKPQRLTTVAQRGSAVIRTQQPGQSTGLSSWLNRAPLLQIHEQAPRIFQRLLHPNQEGDGTFAVDNSVVIAQR